MINASDAGKEKNRPSLYLEQAWWAMGGLGVNGREWSFEEKFEKIAEAGYNGITWFIPKANERERWHQMLDRYHLGFSGLAFPQSVEDLQETLEAARDFGRVEYVNVQVMDSFVTGESAVRLLGSLMECSTERGMPVYIETHRGTVTQDLLRTVEYAEQLEDLKLTIDFSHYVVAGEMDGTGKAAEECFEKLLRHAYCFHARVSDGEKVQIDVGEDGGHPMVEHFKRWWRKGMVNWLQSRKGNVLPFVTELGPPGNYAITYREAGGRIVEASDRWQQALLFKQMAEDLWSEALSEMK